MEYIAKQTADLDLLVPKILEAAKSSGLVAFYGIVGAGKTTLIQRLCSYLGVTEPVTSPTFALANEYHFPKPNGGKGIIYHLDLYRLKSLEEAEQIGLEDYFYNGDYAFVEWPEIAESLLPEDCLRLQMSHLPDSGRKIIFL